MSDKKISELPKLNKAFQNDLLTLEQSGRGKNVTAVQLLGRDTGWRNLSLHRQYDHPNSNEFPQYRKIGKITYLRGKLYIPSSSSSETLENAKSVHVNRSVLYSNSNYLYFLDKNSDVYYQREYWGFDRGTYSYKNIPYRMQPLTDFYVKNIMISRQYTVKNENDVSYTIPITSLVTLKISAQGIIGIKGVSTDEQGGINTGTQAGVYAHPFRIFCTKMGMEETFSNYSQVSVGDNTNDYALKLPVFGTPPITAFESMDTAIHTHLGGFSIPLDGICFISEDDQYYTYTKSLYE